MKNEYDIAQIYKEMELHLISSMQRNLGKHLADEIAEGKEWKMWQAEKLKELKRYQRQNKDIVNFHTQHLNKDIAEILKNEFRQGYKSEVNKYNRLFDKKLSNSFFKLNDRKANVLINVVNNDLNEANHAVLRMMNDTYRQTIHKAATFAGNGVMTQKQAVDMATKDFLNRGLAVIEYKDGKRVNVASYAQMAVRTASQRAMLMGEGEFRKEIGETNVIISKHGTACKLCVPHEGKVYVDDVYSGGKPEDKQQPLSAAMKQGLFHPNCRHGISTYYGLDKEDEQETTVNVPDTNNNNDAARLEREIQRQKRNVAGLQSPDNINAAKQKLKELEARAVYIEAGTIPEAEKFAKDTFNLKVNTYKGLDLRVANEVNKTFVYYKNNYPELLDNINSLGNYQEINKERKKETYNIIYERIKARNPNASEAAIKKAATQMTNKSIGRVSSGTYAASNSHTTNTELDKFKGIYINNVWGNDYDKFTTHTKRDVASKWSPIGTDSVKGIIDHEVGHQLDSMLDIRNEANIQNLFNSRTREQLTDELSSYSWNNNNRDRYSEMIAEGWAEYLNNSNPRAIAKEIGETIERKYAEWKKKNL